MRRSMATPPTGTATMDPDPWTWDTAAVQQFFRGDAIAYMKRRPGTQIPPMAFIQKLGDMEVDGPSLMDMMTPTLLREEFGINGFRQRAAVMYCVELLQKKSRGFETRFDSPQPQTPRSLPPTPVVPQAILAPPSAGVGANVRAGEEQTEDERGRKRRKLDLVQPQLPITESSKPRPDLAAFLPDTALPVDQIFFGATLLGRQVQDLQPTGKVVFQDEDAEKAEYNFGFTYQPCSHGQSEYAFRRLRHFLHSDLENVDVRRHDREAIAIMPYPEKLALDAVSALVIQVSHANGQEFVSVRERAAVVRAAGTDESPLAREDVDANEEGILARWKHTSSDKILDDSDEGEASLSVPGDGEGDLDSDDRSGSESEAEEVEDEGVARSRVSEIIDSEIEKIVTKWHESKLPHLEEKKAWAVWKGTKQSRTLRDSKIAEAQARVRHLTKRLDDQRQACEADEWMSDEALRQVCKNLHATVEDRELLQWKISVWQRRKEPARTVNHRDTRSSRREHGTTTTGQRPHSFVVHADDRMSVEPTTPTDLHHTAPSLHAEDGDDKMDDHASEPEREDFHTPEGTPSPGDFIVSDSRMPDDGAGHSSPFLRSGWVAPIPLTSSPPTAARSRMKQEGKGTQALRRLVDGISSDIKSQSESGLSPLSSFMKLKPSQAPPAPSATPTRSSRPGGISTQPITISSSDAEPDRASSPEPALGKNKKGKGKVKTGSRDLMNGTANRNLPPHFDPEPHHATGDDVDSWDFKTLKQQNDRQRVLIKLLKQAGPERRQSLHNTLGRVGYPPDQLRRLQVTIRTIKSDDQDNSIGRDNGPTDDMLWCARLAMAWYVPAESESADLPWMELGQDDSQLRVFLGFLNKFLMQKEDKLFQNKPRPSNQAILLVSSDDEEVQKARDSPHKKRKRQVKQSHSALMARERARARHDQFAQQVESSEAISSQIEARAAFGPSHSSFRINPHYKKNKSDDGDIAPPPIYINPNIAKHMKPHQVEGVQFMWREVTAAGEEGGQGCLLAHTMGLGKTMQSIALLAAIVEASESSDREIRMQLPANLRPREVGSGKNKRQLRLMILCPPALITNWRNEIEKWAGSALGSIFVVEAASKSKQRQDLEDWHRVGGVLIIGNAVFRNFFKAKKNESEASAAERLAQNEKLLFKGPDVVVADEVHSFKNTSAAISKAVNRIETHTRIGLTGTPMSNDVSEIYSLVNWAAPDFLGDPVEFRAKFQEPIEAGMYGDSSRYEIRKSIMKLKVLHHEIQPKVHRADITVLKGSLKPKTEFVITVPLTSVQTEAYKRYVDALVGGGRNERASQVAIFGWLAVLMLLTNHPSAFMRKLLAPSPAKKKGKGKKSFAEEGELSRDPSPGNAVVSREVALEEGIDRDALKAFGDEDARTLGFSDEQIRQIIGDMEESLDPRLSAKVSILMDILRLSDECGDQVLLFSHSIPTLNFLQQLFIDQGIKHGRLDGTTAMKDRTPLINNFNDKHFNVLLISTRAGGTGLNIQGANRVVIFDFSFNPSWELQAVGRAYRFGQKKPVFVYRFVAGGTFETNLYNKQMFKTDLANRVVDKKNTRRNAQRNTREYLFPPKPVPQDDLLQWLGKDPNVLDRLLPMHGFGERGQVDTLMRSIQTMEVLQQEGEDDPLDDDEQRIVNEEIEAARTIGRGAGGPRRKTADALGGGPASTAPSTSAARSAPHARSMMPPPVSHGLPMAPLHLPAAPGSEAQTSSGPSSTAPQPAARSTLAPGQNIPNGLPFISQSSFNQSGRPRGQ